MHSPFKTIRGREELSLLHTHARYYNPPTYAAAGVTSSPTVVGSSNSIELMLSRRCRAGAIPHVGSAPQSRAAVRHTRLLSIDWAEMVLSDQRVRGPGRYLGRV